MTIMRRQWMIYYCYNSRHVIEVKLRSESVVLKSSTSWWNNTWIEKSYHNHHHHLLVLRIGTWTKILYEWCACWMWMSFVQHSMWSVEQMHVMMNHQIDKRTSERVICHFLWKIRSCKLWINLIWTFDTALNISRNLLT